MIYLPRTHDDSHLDLAERKASRHSGQLTALPPQTQKRLGIARYRLLVAGGFMVAFYGLIALRLIDLMGLIPNTDTLHYPITAQMTPMNRGDIVDRNGVLLATNLVIASLYANPQEILDPNEAAEKLAATLPGLDVDELRAKLSKKEKTFTWIARSLTPEDQARVLSLGLPGLEFQREEKRVYPQGRLLSHILGFTDVDNVGIGGIEHKYDNRLKTSQDPLTLSIDLRVQHIVYDEIKKSIETFSAKGGAGIVMDVNTGEVIAMVSFPDFDPNHPQESAPDDLFNKGTLGVYEMGSMFKIFTVAMALEHGSVTLNSGYDASAPMRVARFKIADFQPKNRWLSVPEIIMYSSNIGAAKMALDVGVHGQRAFMEKLGFLAPSPIELSEVGRPLVPVEWKDINLMTIAYGYGLSVSPLQMTNAMAAMGNGGVLYPATLLKHDPNTERTGTRVISEKTSQTVRKLLRLVVSHGTGRKADVPEYCVGGKTGSANVRNVAGKGYNAHENLSNFVALFPMTRPQYVVLVMLDRPHATKATFGFNTGGWTAAPTVQRIIARAGSLLGVPPVPVNDPAVDQLFHIPGITDQPKGARPPNSSQPTPPAQAQVLEPSAVPPVQGYHHARF